jgi:succinate dehydrogenase / fumarate reductase, cytochrome b subunit
VTTKRPVNLDIGTIHLPITAYASIIHRVSGVALFVIVGLLLWVLDLSLSSPESFASLKECLSGTLFKLILWGCLSALAYHFVAGIRHLIMDLGVGETLEGGRLGAKLVFVFSVVLILLAGAWVW